VDRWILSLKASVAVAVLLLQYPSFGLESSREKFLRGVEKYHRHLEMQGEVSSSQVEDHVRCPQFRELLEFGPVAIPWFAEEPGGVASGIALHVLLRHDEWPNLSGVDVDKPVSENVHLQFIHWLTQSATAEAASNTKSRLESLKTRFPSKTIDSNLHEILKSDEWKHLKGMGVLGIPTVMKRIQSGESDRLDYRLVNYWTSPVIFKDGLPVRPEEVEPPSERQNRAYWIDWWETNRWQYIWLTGGD
jgi:hypothetical protein